MSFAVIAVTVMLAGCSSGTIDVSKADFESRGLKCPLTVDKGRVGCTTPATWIEIDGTKFGLNGFAGSEQGYAEIKPLWRVDEQFQDQMRAIMTAKELASLSPQRISIADLASEADKAC